MELHVQAPRAPAFEDKSVLDGALLPREDAWSPQQIAALRIFAGLAVSGLEMQPLMAAGAERIPRHCGRLQQLPVPRVRPVWRDAPKFDLAERVMEER